MVFWVTNQVRGPSSGWNLARVGTHLTAGVVRRLLGSGRVAP